ncbi:MAG: radical SAM protein [Candidatus Bathyarchaeota archaeon]|nr:radical SAM protein [Candidatus Bathyarchaeota archaeon]
MVPPFATQIWEAPDTELLTLLNSATFSPKTRKIHFYAPSFMYYKTSHYQSKPDEFPTISITGNVCTLKCKHCEGKVLKTMYAATTPQKLIELCVELKRKGALGCLISGGCSPRGSVPLESFLPSIAKIKRDLNLTFLVHTGIINSDTAQQLKDAGVDAALIDIIGSDETIQEIYNLKVTVKDYADSLRALQNAKIDFVPHVIVGLHNGKLKGELAALNMIAMYKPAAVVIIAFMPIAGTSMANTLPPKPLDIAKVTATARFMFPHTPIVLGCMRPKGKHRCQTDILALKAGVDAIAFPTEDAIQHAKQQGYNITFSSYCCSQIYKNLKPKTT